MSLTLLTLTCLSCESVRIDQMSDGSVVPLSLDAPVIEPSSETKVSIDGNNFPNAHEAYPLGLWIMQKDDTTTPQIDGYTNMKVDYKIADGLNTWYYYPFGIDKESVGNIYVLKAKPVDIYAYYPWVAGATDMTKIPFESGENDWMVASKISLSETETTSAVQADLAFRHLMTCIQVDIRCEYEGGISLTSITLTDSKGRLIADGTFNCIDGSISGTPGNSITITPKRALNTSYVSNYIIMPEVTGLDLSDGEIKISFVFNNIEAESVFTLPSKMKVGEVDTEIDSFKAGYKYKFNLVLDNTMDFVPVGVEQAWQTKDVLLPI